MVYDLRKSIPKLSSSKSGVVVVVVEGVAVLLAALVEGEDVLQLLLDMCRFFIAKTRGEGISGD
jgi:hypothetical protein